MSLIAIVCFVLAGVVAVVDWILTPRTDDTWRWVTKASVPALLTASVVLTGLARPHPAWAATFVAGALCFALLGDLLLLGRGRFMYGALAFAGAQTVLAVTLAWRAWAGPVQQNSVPGIPEGGWTGLGVAAVVVVAGFLAVGIRLIRAAHRDRLGLVVTFYIVLISVMVMAASLHVRQPGGWWVIGAALLFYVSDALLGWKQFVSRDQTNSVAVMVTYHLAIFGFAWWALLRSGVTV